MPQVSVVIPTHNRAHMLNEALGSVLAQTYHDFEIIVIDDGSTDNTPAICRKHHTRIRYIYQESRGRSAARNAGITTAQGNYIAFLDDDDVWLPRKLGLQVDALERDRDVDLVYGPLYVTAGGCRSIMGEPPGLKDPLEWLLFDPCITNPSVMMARRRTFDRVGLFDAAMEPCEDWDFLIRIALKGGRFRFIDEPLAEYRLHSSNTISQIDRMNAAHFAVLEKVFALPEMPHILSARRRHYVSRSWIRLGNERYVNLQIGAAWTAWRQAMKLDPSVLTLRLLSSMVKSLVGPRVLRWAREARDALIGESVE
jgi:glycosyltransferase involved in cell wall biosynthesis